MSKNKNGNNFESSPEIRIVEASAGSGKTYALAKRYVQLLIGSSQSHEDIPLKTILAITFTNKATIEMKERILDLLKKIALDAFENKSEEDEILNAVPVETARRRAHRAMDLIIRNYDYFQVRTIDSFINAVVSGCALKLNLSSHFEIQTDHAQYLAYSIDCLIERAGKDKAILSIFKEFLAQYIHIENKSKWLPKQDILKLIKELYNGNNKYGKDYVKIMETSVEEIAAQKKDILSHARNVMKKLPAKVDSRFARALQGFVSEDNQGFRIADLSKYFSYDAIPVNKGCVLDQDAIAGWDTLRYGLQRVASYEAYTFFNCYIDIFMLISEYFNARSRKDNILFLEELNRKANGLFESEKMIVPELYYRLAARFRHFLIDEFQDTSELQWRNLLPMVEEALSTGGSLFYVGDKKQAIYGFRGGDAALFDSAPESFAHLSPAKEVLNKNYRSCKEIVEFNNDIFSDSNLARFAGSIYEDEKKLLPRFNESEIKDVLHIFSDARQLCHEENRHGCVRIEHLDADSAGGRNDDMRQKLPALINELNKRFSYKDIAILARNNGHVELFTAWLMAAGIPVGSDKTLNVRENPVVKEIVSFLKFLLSPIDNLAFASFITGGVFSKASGISTDEIKEFIFSAQRDDYLYSAFRKKFPQSWNEFIEEFYINVGFVPIYELAVTILRKYKVLDSFGAHHAFILRLLEIIKDRESENTSLAALIDYLEQSEDHGLYIATTDMDSVKILTMHKVKGLQFPVVVIPFLEMDVTLSGRDLPSYHVAINEKGISLVHLNKDYARHSEELDALYRAKYKENFISELNVVYVALTRPQKELYAFIPKKVKASNNPVRKLINEETQKGCVKNLADFCKWSHESPCHSRSPLSPTESIRGRIRRSIRNPRFPPEPCGNDKCPQESLHNPQKVSFPGLPKSENHRINISVPVYKDLVSLLSDEITDSSRLINRKNVKRGEAIHYMLSFLGNINGAKLQATLNYALEQTKRAFPDEETDSIGQLVSNMIVNPEIAPFFLSEGAEVFCEKEIVTSNGLTKRIDRLIVRKGRVDVIDYKSSHEDADQHKKQVKGYMELLKDIYPGQEIKGYIIYCDTSAVEEIKIACHPERSEGSLS